MKLPCQSLQGLLRMLFLLTSVCCSNISGEPATLARLGQDVTLPCHFRPAVTRGLIIEWTLQQSSVRVAYSYHSGAAQNGSKHRQFSNRTEVEPDLLKLGEASLRLRAVAPQDEGPYLCYVRSALGKHEEWQQLQVAGSYSKPKVSCSPAPPSINLTCRSTGGYPQSEARWQWVNGTWLSWEADSRCTRSSEGTYDLQSWLVVPTGMALWLRCLVDNRRLNQTVASTGVCGTEDVMSTGGRRSNGTACTDDCGITPGSRWKPRARLGIIGSALTLLLFLALFGCLQNSPGPQSV